MKTQRTRIAVYGLLVENKEILLCRLSKQVAMSAGQWTLPGGGMDFGEKPEDTLIREFKEETGLTVLVGPILKIDSFCEEFTNERLHSIRILYAVTRSGGTLRRELNGTTDECGWFDAGAARSLPTVPLAKTGIELATSLGL